MEVAILLSLAASFCTATASVCQRAGARNLELSGLRVRGFDPWLVFRLAAQPVWLLGLASMIAGFLLQVSAMRFGPLVLVQLILAAELLFVFGYLAVLTRFRGVRWREWLAAVAMSAGIGVFLCAASPSGGRLHAPAGLWWLAGLAAAGAVLLAAAAASGRSSSRRAALLGVAAGVSWGFVAAVIKELSAQVGGGPAAVFGSWPVYVLIAAGAAAMLLTSHAMAAGPLAAAQPGFTILDPLTAIVLGVVLFSERLRAAPAAVAAELLGLAVLAAGSWALSRSDLIAGRPAGRPAVHPAARLGGPDSPDSSDSPDRGVTRKSW